MEKQQNFWCTTNIKLWREMPHVGLEVIANVQLAFWTGTDNKIVYEITDVFDFEKFTYGGKEIKEWDGRKKVIAFLKETLGIEVYDEIEKDVTDVVNDIGVEEYFFQQTGLKFIAPVPAKPKKCKTCGK